MSREYAIIDLKDVHKSFGPLHILRGVDLRVREGETFVILGPSGCGKSVTLKVIIGLLRADSGSVRVWGEDVTRFTEAEFDEMRRRIGMVFQAGALFDSLNVWENVTFPLERHTDMGPEERRTKATELLALVGLQDIEDKMPSELSGGMRKRVSVARAIALEPELILFDEPTTGLDPVMTTEIDELINSLKARFQMTSLTVTHDIKSAFRTADRIGVHYQGKLVQIGTPEDIQSSENEFVHRFIRGIPEDVDSKSLGATSPGEPS